MATDYNPILESILSAMSSRLNEVGRKTGRVDLTTGLPAWDDCCEGQLYLYVINAYPSVGQGAPFPQKDSQQRGVNLQCAVGTLALQLGMGIIRCAPSLSDEGEAPSSAAVSAGTTSIIDDLSDMLDVIVCEVSKLAGVKQVKLDGWTPQQPQGGCAGGEWAFFIAVDPCLCQPLPTSEE